ncbi:MAG: enoyl-CoA hydratase-related protein [Chitinophagales bacterium]|nr:enoyl-CoA hydratase-related protein [Chitinophagales bacterium]MDW8393807.1 enoyl-CoA hydratase-related protein [Chitinophagales bacterium]
MKTILIDQSDGILVATINRPEKLNALNQQVFQELDELLDTAERDESVRGLILTGAGNKAFVAGADISEFAGYTSQQAEAMSRNGHRVFDRIERLSLPVIAAVNGFALGGGCELAMACHLRIASESARFGQPEINLGIIPGYGGTQRLPALVGKARALELLLTADMISAQQALEYGLVNHVVPSEELIPRSRALLLRIAEKSPLVVRRILSCVHEAVAGNRNGFEREVSEFAACMETEDFREGTQAFLEKRKPKFTGR